MSLRGFGNQTLGATAQPVFGTSLSAAATPSPDPYTGRLDPGSMNSSTLLLLNAPAYIFRQGDHVLIGTTASFQQNSTIAPDGGTVQQVTPSASNILVTGLQRKHSASEWVILALPCASVGIQTPSTNSGAQIYLGEDPSVGATSQSLIALILKGTQTPPFTIPFNGAGVDANEVETQRLWVSGTAGDTFLPSMLTI